MDTKVLILLTLIIVSVYSDSNRSHFNVIDDDINATTIHTSPSLSKMDPTEMTLPTLSEYNIKSMAPITKASEIPTSTKPPRRCIKFSWTAFGLGLMMPFIGIGLGFTVKWLRRRYEENNGYYKI